MLLIVLRNYDFVIFAAAISVSLITFIRLKGQFARI